MKGIYHKIIAKTTAILFSLIKKGNIVAISISSLHGYCLCKKIKKKYGKKTKIILSRGATGDIYLQYIMLPEYLNKNRISSYVVVGDGRFDITTLFGRWRMERLTLYDSESIERAYKLVGSKVLDLVITFPWTDVLAQVNKCRLRMTNYFNFMDSYSIFTFQMKRPFVFQLPKFVKKDYHLEYSCYKRNIQKGRTVIIAPFACSVTSIFPMFWNAIILELIDRGYLVYINDNHFNYLRAQNLFFSYEESVPLLEYAGYFIGLRSGLCDIISSAKCKKIILYPQTPDPMDYSVHRTDIQFSSLKKMGLCEDAIEIETNFSWDIKNKKPHYDNDREFMKEYEQIIRKILKEFPSLCSNNIL